MVMLFNIFNWSSMRVWCILSLLFGHCVCKVYFDKLDRYIISCHTTDFECFKRQYKALRDNVLLGNDRLGIPTYEHYVFAYGGGTCVKLTGLEESELAAIKIQHRSTAEDTSRYLQVLGCNNLKSIFRSLDEIHRQ
ncbi:hypothetical protein HF086_009448 [Spodoptera exigua]|uniref:Uncharacterized protein n=1 Tax=Spodoptera exigua TaxID=7107 RepID=A0A922MG11_SPOEX|nr:hypothetical protein HF086_009448 [Spodoptera exigua]